MSSTLQQIQIPNDPDLKDLLDLLRKDIFLNLNVHHIGVVQSFDIDNQTAQVTIAYPKTYYKLNSKTNQYDPVQVDYPVLLDCPIISLGGGNAAVTLPITAGDECLVLFNDRNFNNWWNGGAGAQVATARLHSFADAIILVGLRSSGNILANYDPNRGVLRGISGVVGVSDKVLITNDTPSIGGGGTLSYSTTLNTLLQSLITDLKTLIAQTAAITVTPGTLAGPSSPPLNAGAINAVSSSLTSVATQIAGLLE